MPELSVESVRNLIYGRINEYFVNLHCQQWTQYPLAGGTELNLVNRLHERFQDQVISPFLWSPTVCWFNHVSRRVLQHLLWVIWEKICGEGHVGHQVSVDPVTAKEAKLLWSGWLALPIYTGDSAYAETKQAVRNDAMKWTKKDLPLSCPMPGYAGIGMPHPGCILKSKVHGEVLVFLTAVKPCLCWKTHETTSWSGLSPLFLSVNKCNFPVVMRISIQGDLWGVPGRQAGS